MDERTYRATRFQIDFRPEPLLLAKGKAEPVPVWSVVQPRARTGADPARLQRPLVGRAHETQVLIDALARAVAGGEPQIVTLVGPPGIGKSRQVWQLAQHLEGETDLVFWRQGRSLPYGDGVTFWALGEIVKANAGILATDPAANVEEKLRIAVEYVVDDANEARWIEAHLAPLAGLTSARELRGDRRTEAFAAWRRFLELIAARSPLVLVFEDIHWADDGLLEFITTTLATASPARCWWWPPAGRSCSTGGRSGPAAARSTMLELQPLSDQETADVVTNLLDAAELPPELRSALLARAGGNPLFAEEYVRMLLDRGLLRSERSGPELTGSDLPLPESVQSIIAARLDALPSDEKLLLQDAAVVGRAFWLGALAEVGQRQRWSVEHMLHELERKQLLRRESDSIVLTEPQYAFSHALVRDVAYEQIPRARRSRKHWRTAGWIESLSPERTEDRAEMLSHHYMRALRYLPQGDDGQHRAAGRGAQRALRCRRPVDVAERVRRGGALLRRGAAAVARRSCPAGPTWPSGWAAHRCMPRAAATGRWSRPAMRSSPRASPGRRPRRWC